MKMKLKKFIDSSPSGRLNLFDSVRDDEVENRAEEPNDKRGENGSENQAPFTQQVELCKKESQQDIDNKTVLIEVLILRT